MARSNSLFFVIFALFVAQNFVIAIFHCNFSSDMCGFIDSAGVNQSWIRTNSSTIDPGHDHTCMSDSKPYPDDDDDDDNDYYDDDDYYDDETNFKLAKNLNPMFRSNHSKFPGIIKNERIRISIPKKNCYWLSSLPVSKFKDNQDFIIISPKQNKMNNDGCLRFYYHFFGLSHASFYVQINNKSSTFDATNLWARYVPQGNRWAHAQVHIPKQDSEFYIIFNARLTSKYHDVVGIDDVFYTSSPCPLERNTDFESTNNAWTLDGVNITTGGYPIKDHTTNTNAGHYAISTSKQPSTLTISIKNLTQSSTSNNCLKLYYQFISNNNDMDTESYLEVNISNYQYYNKRITIESLINDGLDNTWQLISVNIPSYKRLIENNNTNVIVSMYTKKNTKIAIDDIFVLDRLCESSGECDFETDFCGWSSLNNFNGAWIRSDGANIGNMKESPRIDHTTLTENGWFAMIPTEFLNDRVYATLKSPPLDGTYSSVSCFKMSYFAHTKLANQSVLSVSIHDLTYKQATSATIVYGTSYGFWANFSMKFPKKIPKHYSIEISTNYLSDTLLSDIAIDDLKLSYWCNDGNDNPSTLPTTAIPYSERKWDCSFQYYCSGWKFDSNWVLTSFSKLGILKNSSNPPRVDHTYNQHTGGYLLYLPKEHSDLNSTVPFISFINSTIISAKPHCFSFYYYDASEILISIDIRIHKKLYSYIEKSIRPNSASRQWTLIKVDLQYNYQEFNISLILHAGRGANASFAIDDIKLVPGRCGHMDDYIYTLDQYENMDTNIITPIRNGIGQLANPLSYYIRNSFPNSPKYDHTTGKGGYFLFMNRKDDYNTTYKTELIIDDLDEMKYQKNIKGRCIKFAYQVFGNAKLRVYVDPVNSNYHSYTLFSTEANHTNWIIAQQTYSAYYKHKISFLMEKHYDTTSYIAIDDISLSNNCDYRIQCDFDDNICSYTSDYSSSGFTADYEFARFVAPPITAQWPGPSYDHTKQSYGGGYLYLTGYPSQDKFKRSAQIQTPIISIYTSFSNSCISFFTFITGPDAQVKLSARFFSPDKDPIVVSLINLTGITETKWTRHYVDIDAKFFKSKTEFILLIDGSTTDPNTVIAIDDIDYSLSECSYRNQFKCDNGHSVAIDNVCNFHDDCGDKSDEKNCGTCNFEAGLCGWYNGSDYYNSKVGGQWVPVKAGDISDKPITDGNNNKSGHYLLVEKSIYSDKIYTLISSTSLTRRYNNYNYQFKDAYFTCYMTFLSNIQSHNGNRSFASLQVWAGSNVDSSVIKLNINNNPLNSDWNLNAVFIGGFPHSFVIEFRATELSINETIAIDDIQFHNCSFPDPVKDTTNCPDDRAMMCNTTNICISPEDLCDFENNCGDNWDESYAFCSSFMSPDVPISCAFERSLDTCSMTANYVPNTNLIWQIVQGNYYSFISQNMPSADHTTKDKNGKYIALSTRAYQHNLGMEALLYSPMMHSDSDPCIVRFFYYNNGDYSTKKTNVFRVYVQYADGNLGESGNLFSSDSYLSTWNKAKAKFTSKDPFRFVFSGVLNDVQGSISLDDLSYTSSCYNSDAVYRPGSPHNGFSVFVIILLIVISLTICGGAFFVYRKAQTGELSFDSIQIRVRSFIPGSRNSPTAFENPHFTK